MPLATGLHQVDNPAIDAEGRVYVTYSGSRGQQAPVSDLSGRRPAARASRSSPASSTRPRWRSGPTGGSTCRAASTAPSIACSTTARHEVVASDLGLACGLAFAPDGTLFVGDRSGTIFHIDAKGRTDTLATLPASVAAFHLAMGPDDALYVTGPTLASYDRVYRVSMRRRRRDRRSDASAGRRAWPSTRTGVLHVVEALAGVERRLPPATTAARTLVVAGARLVGLAFGANGTTGRRDKRHGLRLRVNSAAQLRRTHVRTDPRPTPACLYSRASPSPSSSWPSEGTGAIAEARARRRRSGDAGDRRGDRRRHLRRDRHGGGRTGRARTARSFATAPGPALILSFVLLGGACALAALCYAELAAMIPQAGSAYAYSYATLGELVAWIIGWDLILEYAVGNVAVAISWGDYFNDAAARLRHRAAGVPDDRLSHGASQLESRNPRPARHARRALPGMPILLNLPAFAIVMLITWLLLRGARESSRANNVMVVIKLLVLALFIGAGADGHQPGELHAVCAERVHRHPSGRGDRLLRLHRLRRDLDGRRGDAEPAAQPADRHSRRPGDLHGDLCRRRHRPHRHGAVQRARRRRSAGARARADRLHATSRWIVALGAIVSMATVLLVFQYGQPRIFFAMARDGLLPRVGGASRPEDAHSRT